MPSARHIFTHAALAAVTLPDNALFPLFESSWRDLRKAHALLGDCAGTVTCDVYAIDIEVRGRWTDFFRFSEHSDGTIIAIIIIAGSTNRCICSARSASCAPM